jgi:hypothetical protein
LSDFDIAAAVRQVIGDALGYLPAAALRVAVQYDIADHLADGPKTFTQLADITKVDGAALGRVLRLLATRGIFRVEGDTVHLTPTAGLLRADSPLPLRHPVSLFTDKLYWQPSGQLDQAVRKGGTTFDDVFGAQFFDHLGTDEARARLFDKAMSTMSMTEQGPIAAAYDFPETGTVLDIAGGQGGFLRTVLTANPGLTGVLFDREEVLQGHQLDDPSLAGRWQTATGDFFEAVPPGADIYVLKRIIHDKSETDARRILRSVRQAMSDSARLLVVDAVLPQDGAVTPSAALADVLMLSVFEGRERTEAEFRDLLAAEGLKLNRVVPTPTALSVIEAVAT